MKKLTGSAKIAMIGAILSVVAAICCIIYGAVYSQYSDYTVVLTLILGGLLMACYAYVDSKICAWFNILGVAASSFGLGLFMVNSYNVWADTFGNIQQYGSLTGAFHFFNSEGGPIPAALLIALGLAAAICGIISCFRERGTNQ